MVAALTALVLPSSGAAHAVLERSDPQNDVVLQRPPSDITLTFSEAVEPVGGIRVFDGDAVEVAVGEQQLLDPTTSRTPLRGTLRPGTYTVVWRELSADGHVVNGAFVFHYRKRGPNPGGVIGTIGTGAPPAWLRTLSSMARWWNLTTLILLVGGIAGLLTYLARRAGEVEAKLWYVVSALGFVLSISSALTIVLQGAEVRGLTIGGSETGGMIGDVVGTQFGRVRLAQLLLAELIAVVAVWGASSRRGAPTVALLAACATALAATPALSGHALAVGPIGIVSDTVHVLAVSVWVGGLVFVTLALTLARGGQVALARAVIPGFSRVAVVAVGVVILSGTASSLYELGGIGYLFTTTYGRLLLIKVVLALVLVVIGASNRRLVPRLPDGDATGTVAGLRRNLSMELGVVACVIAATTLLVAQPPPRAVASGGGPQVARTTVNGNDVRIEVDPGRAGPNLVHVYLSRNGRSFDPTEVRAEFTNTDAGLGPISAPTVRNEPGHYIARSVPLTAPGRWTIVVRLRQGDFTSDAATVTVTLRPAPITN